MILLLVATIVMSIAIWMHRLRAQRRQVAGYQRYRLQFPKDVSAKMVTHVLRHIVPSRRRWQRFSGVDVISFEVVATDTEIEHFIWLSPHRLDHVRAQLYAAFPGLRLEPAATASTTPTSIPLRIDVSSRSPTLGSVSKTSASTPRRAMSLPESRMTDAALW